MPHFNSKIKTIKNDSCFAENTCYSMPREEALAPLALPSYQYSDNKACEEHCTTLEMFYYSITHNDDGSADCHCIRVPNGG